jgi:GntP family gluconate:H+ symporter
MDGYVVLILLMVSVAIMIYLTGKIKINAFLVLLVISLFMGVASGIGMTQTVNTVAKGFGDTMQSIGIVIALGTIIGKVLERSGGAIAMAESILRRIGKKRVPEAMSMIGYIISIPVFCDSGFIIVSPLNKALSNLSGFSLAVTSIALSTGLYATHTLVPPTPGPIAAAGNLGADLGLVIGLGLLVSVPAACAGLLYARKVGSKIWVEPKTEITYEEYLKKFGKLPSAKWAFASIIVPVILIVLKSVAEFPTKPFGTGIHTDFLGFIGNPILALLIGVLISLKLVPKLDESIYGPESWIGDALKEGAMILLITGAGGSFGSVIRATGVGDYISGALSDLGMNGLIVAFIIAALIKTSQGSSTVSLITTSAIMASLLPALGLATTSGKVLTTLAIGAGSMVVSHANDSYFWVVTLYSNMDTVKGYKLQTGATLVEGLAAIAMVMLLSVFLI